MSQTTATLITLIVYKVVLVLIGWAAQRKTRDGADFFLGGRTMGPSVAALSASASSSSAWTLLGVSGAAYAWGLSALWLFPACVGGFLLNWIVLAPGLRRVAAREGAITVTDLLAGDASKPFHRAIIYLASAIILFSFLFYVASQFQGSGKTFQSTFGLSAETSIAIGAVIIIFYTMVGGFWAVSLTDALQGLVMAATAVVLPVGALFAVGGFGGLGEGLDQAGADFASLGGNAGPAVTVGFVVGLLGIGIGYPGQPHVVNRFMALKDEASVGSGRMIAIAWALIVYTGMLLLGLCGRVLYPGVGDAELIFLEAVNGIFHPVIGGIMIAAVLSATMSTADSQLLVASSSIANDLPHFEGRDTLRYGRWTVLALSLASVAVAFIGTQEIFSRVLFAWSALGSAFGPLLLVTVLRGRVRGGYTLAAMATGFFASVILYSFPETKGAFERWIPFLSALSIALFGVERDREHPVP